MCHIPMYFCPVCLCLYENNNAMFISLVFLFICFVYHLS